MRQIVEEFPLVVLFSALQNKTEDINKAAQVERVKGVRKITLAS